MAIPYSQEDQNALFKYGSWFPVNTDYSDINNQIPSWPLVYENKEEKYDLNKFIFSNGVTSTGESIPPSYIPAESINLIMYNLSRFILKMGGYYDAKTSNKNQIGTLFTYNPPLMVSQDLWNTTTEIDSEYKKLFSTVISLGQSDSREPIESEDFSNCEGLHTTDGYSFRASLDKLVESDIFNAMEESDGKVYNDLQWPIIDIDIVDGTYPEKTDLGLGGAELMKSIPIRAFDGTMRANGPKNLLLNSIPNFIFDSVSDTQISENFINTLVNRVPIYDQFADKSYNRPKWLYGDKHSNNEPFLEQEQAYVHPTDIKYFEDIKTITETLGNTMVDSSIYARYANPAFFSKYVDSQNVVTKRELDIESYTRHIEDINRQKATSIQLQTTQNLLGYNGPLEGTVPDFLDSIWKSNGPTLQPPGLDDKTLFAQSSLTDYTNIALRALIQEIKDLRKRCTDLETRCSNLETKDNNLDTDIAGLNTRITNDKTDETNKLDAERLRLDKIELRLFSGEDEEEVNKALDSWLEISKKIASEETVVDTMGTKLTNLETSFVQLTAEVNKKAPLNSPTFTGNAIFNGDITVNETLFIKNSNNADEIYGKIT